jgi:hypothetical protein
VDDAGTAADALVVGAQPRQQHPGARGEEQIADVSAVTHVSEYDVDGLQVGTQLRQQHPEALRGMYGSGEQRCQQCQRFPMCVFSCGA